VHIADLEREIDRYVENSASCPAVRSLLARDQLNVIKYMPADHLADVLARGQLYAAERAGFTWGDALYVAPLAFPFTTMMYGEVGVVGRYLLSGARFFDADDDAGIRLYQEWIMHQDAAYRELTTTVHANAANRELRNTFRTRFQIDCVCFRPDESCLNYVNMVDDWWLAITHWDAFRIVGHGYSGVITDLKWCVVAPDAFKPDGRGYKALLHKTLTASHACITGHYSTLTSDIVRAYQDLTNQVVVCDFN
jgi:hypothetical protein